MRPPNGALVGLGKNELHGGQNIMLADLMHVLVGLKNHVRADAKPELAGRSRSEKSYRGDTAEIRDV